MLLVFFEFKRLRLWWRKYISVKYILFFLLFGLFARNKIRCIQIRICFSKINIISQKWVFKYLLIFSFFFLNLLLKILLIRLRDCKLVDSLFFHMYVQCREIPYCFEKLSSVYFLLSSFPPAMGGSNVSNPIQPISHWNRLSSAAPYPHPLPRRFFFAINRYICGPRHLWYNLLRLGEGTRCDYRWCSRIFRATNNIRLYVLVAAIPRYLEVRCYGQAYVISALTYRSRSAILFPAFSYAAACGICGSFTYLLCARDKRRERT